MTLILWYLAIGALVTAAAFEGAKHDFDCGRDPVTWPWFQREPLFFLGIGLLLWPWALVEGYRSDSDEQE